MNQNKRVQKLLKQKEPLVLKGYKHNSKLSLEKFLYNFLHDYNIMCNTKYSTSDLIQTFRCRRRSLGDIYRICVNYYPNIELKDITNYLYNYKWLASNQIGTNYCLTIDKRVWGTDDVCYDYPISVINLNCVDEYGNKPEDYLQ